MTKEKGNMKSQESRLDVLMGAYATGETTRSYVREKTDDGVSAETIAKFLSVVLNEPVLPSDVSSWAQ